MKLKTLVASTTLALAALTGVAAHAQAAKAGAITIENPYARATGTGQKAGGGYLKLVNGGPEADRLLSASADVATTVELHEMKMEGDVMKMRQVEGIAVPAGKTVELAPGGYHVMFVGLKAPLKSGDSFPLKLKFEKAGDVTVNMKIQAVGAGGGPGGMDHSKP